MKQISLRPVQENAIPLIREAFKQGHRKVILQAPCSFGKTRLAARIIQSIIENGKRAYFICDRITLIDQAANAFDKFDIPLGVIQGQNERTNYDAPLQVCSIQSLANRKNLPHADVILVDECHSVHKSLIKLMSDWDNIRFIGLTATAYTKGLGKIWDTLVIGARIPELIDKKYLVPLDEYGAPVGFDLKKIKKQGADYSQKDLAKASNKKTIIGDIIKNWKRLGENRQTLLFAVNIVHSKHATDLFNSAGIPAAHMDCYTSTTERNEIYKKFESKEIRILSSVDINIKGYDSPLASCLILARATKSLIIYVQMLGRGQRLHEGKKDCIIIDCGDNVKTHGFITDPLPELLCMGNKNESEKKKKEEPKAVKCSKCKKWKKPKVHKCPNCGFAPEKQNNVDNTDHILVKLDKVERSVKNEWYAMLLHYARSKGYSDGWSSHKYKAKFSVWPAKKTGVYPKPPNKEVLGFIQHLQIKARYDKKKETA